MIKKTLYSIIFILILSVLANAAEILTLNDFVRAAIETNPRYQITVKEYLIALNANKSEKAIEDWNLIASATKTDGSPPPSSIPITSDSSILTYTLGIEKYFSQTGTGLKVDVNNSKVDSDFPPFPGVNTPPSPYYIGSLSVTITQPLLKDAFGMLARSSLKLSDHAFELAEIKLEEDWEDFITSLKDDYYYWQKCYLDVHIYEDKLIKVKDQLSLIKKQTEVGLSEELDLVLTEQMVKGYEIMLESAKMACENQTKKILKMINKDEGGSNAVSPDKFVRSVTFPDKNRSMEYLKTGSNIKKTTDLMVSLSKTSLDMKQNEELPNIDLMLSGSPNTSQSNFQDSIDKIGTENYYTVSLNVSRPLFNDRASAAANKANEEHEKAKSERDEIMLNSEIGLSNLYSTLLHLDQMASLNEENVKLANERLRLEKKKYDQGRSSIFFLLQAEDSLLEAEKNLNQTLYGREQTINQINSITDQYTVIYKDVLKIQEN